MELDKLRKAGVPMGPLSEPATMYRGASANVKIHGDQRCDLTKADLYATTVVLVDHPDRRYCWRCAQPAGTAYTYYRSAVALTEAAERLDILTERTGADGRPTSDDPSTSELKDVHTAAAIEATIRQGCSEAASSALDEWAAPLLARAQAVLADLTGRCAHATDPDLAVRLVALDSAERNSRDADRRRLLRRSEPNNGRHVPYDKSSYPALCAGSYSFEQQGHDGAVSEAWDALRAAYLTVGNLEAAAQAAAAAAREVLNEATGPRHLEQVPSESVLGTVCGQTLGEAIVTAWKVAALAEVEPLCRELAQAVAHARHDIEHGDRVVAYAENWRETHRAAGDESSTVLARWSPTALPAGKVALVILPEPVLDWLENRPPFKTPTNTYGLKELGPALASDDETVLFICLTLLTAHGQQRSQHLRSALRDYLPQARAAAYQEPVEQDLAASS